MNKYWISYIDNLVRPRYAVWASAVVISPSGAAVFYSGNIMFSQTGAIIGDVVFVATGFANIENVGKND